MMLAFVFWHWPYPEVAAQAYETRLAGFHRSLAQAGPQDFQGSVAFRIDGAPWIPTGERGYEDWYLMDGSAGMDILNEAAVAAVCKEAHDGIAEYAAGGAGGLYQLREGTGDVKSCSHTLWLSKPRTTGYQEFYAHSQQWTNRPGVSLWRRHLVLGPAPEFCLLAPEPLQPPDVGTVSTARLHPVWP